MKLIGEVEVFKILHDGTSKSVVKENNMVVDGASEVIVDMLTTPYSLKNVTNSGALDCSNFTVRAVTLGKAENLYGGTASMSSADTSDIGMHAVYNNSYFSSMYLKGLNTSDPSAFGDIVNATRYGPSSPFTLPKNPSPRDTRLENSSKTQIDFYYENSAIALSSYAAKGTTVFNPTSGTLLPEMGHNLNALYSSGNCSNVAAFHQGCYAPSDGMSVRIFDGTENRTTLEVTSLNNPIRALKNTTNASADVSGRYNVVGSMDERGFLVAYPIQHHPASADTTQGMGVSAATADALAGVSYTGDGLVDGSTAFIKSPAVCYNFTISSGDMACLALYKGVTNIGLWAFDLKETLPLVDEFPIAWTTPSNNRRYKLFAKKVFNEDLTFISDAGDSEDAWGIGNYRDLKIQWKMSFSFGTRWGE